jgi:hypothetical protein
LEQGFFAVIAASRGVGAIVKEELLVVVDMMVAGVQLVAGAFGGGFRPAVVVWIDADCLLVACSRADALLVAAGLGWVAVCLMGHVFDAVGYWTLAYWFQYLTM